MSLRYITNKQIKNEISLKIGDQIHYNDNNRDIIIHIQFQNMSIAYDVLEWIKEYYKTEKVIFIKDPHIIAIRIQLKNKMYINEDGLVKTMVNIGSKQ